MLTTLERLRDARRPLVNGSLVGKGSAHIESPSVLCIDPNLSAILAHTGPGAHRGSADGSLGRRDDIPSVDGSAYALLDDHDTGSLMRDTHTVGPTRASGSARPLPRAMEVRDLTSRGELPPSPPRSHAGVGGRGVWGSPRQLTASPVSAWARYSHGSSSAYDQVAAKALETVQECRRSLRALDANTLTPFLVNTLGATVVPPLGAQGEPAKVEERRLRAEKERASRLLRLNALAREAHTSSHLALQRSVYLAMLRGPTTPLLRLRRHTTPLTGSGLPLAGAGGKGGPPPRPPACTPRVLSESGSDAALDRVPDTLPTVGGTGDSMSHSGSSSRERPEAGSTPLPPSLLARGAGLAGVGAAALATASGSEWASGSRYARSDVSSHTLPFPSGERLSPQGSGGRTATRRGGDVTIDGLSMAALAWAPAVDSLWEDGGAELGVSSAMDGRPAVVAMSGSELRPTAAMVRRPPAVDAMGSRQGVAGEWALSADHEGCDHAGSADAAEAERALALLSAVRVLRRQTEGLTAELLRICGQDGFGSAEWKPDGVPTGNGRVSRCTKGGGGGDGGENGLGGAHAPSERFFRDLFLSNPRELDAVDSMERHRRVTRALHDALAAKTEQYHELMATVAAEAPTASPAGGLLPSPTLSRGVCRPPTPRRRPGGEGSHSRTSPLGQELAALRRFVELYTTPFMRHLPPPPPASVQLQMYTVYQRTVSRESAAAARLLTGDGDAEPVELGTHSGSVRDRMRAQLRELRRGRQVCRAAVEVLAQHYEQQSAASAAAPGVAHEVAAEIAEGERDARPVAVSVPALSRGGASEVSLMDAAPPALTGEDTNIFPSEAAPAALTGATAAAADGHGGGAVGETAACAEQVATRTTVTPTALPWIAAVRDMLLLPSTVGEESHRGPLGAATAPLRDPGEPRAPPATSTNTPTATTMTSTTTPTTTATATDTFEVTLEELPAPSPSSGRPAHGEGEPYVGHAARGGAGAQCLAESSDAVETALPPNEVVSISRAERHPRRRGSGGVVDVDEGEAARPGAVTVAPPLAVPPSPLAPPGPAAKVAARAPSSRAEEGGVSDAPKKRKRNILRRLFSCV